MNRYQPYNTDHWVRRSSRSWSTRTQGARILSEETTRAPEVDESEETTHELDDDGLTPELRVFWSRREFGVGDTVALAPNVPECETCLSGCSAYKPGTVLPGHVLSAGAQGVVIEVTQGVDDEPYKVKGEDGATYWYEAAQLVAGAAPDRTHASPTIAAAAAPGMGAPTSGDAGDASYEDDGDGESNDEVEDSTIETSLLYETSRRLYDARAAALEANTAQLERPVGVLVTIRCKLCSN